MGSEISLQGCNFEPPKSALGQKQTSRPEILMSALPPKADIADRDQNVRISRFETLHYAQGAKFLEIL